MSDLISRSELMKECSCKKNCADCDFYTDGDSWCYGEVYGTTIMRMPSVEVPGWISVKDKSRRPKDGERVWCYGSGYYFTAYYDEVQETDYGLNPFGFYELHINPVSLGAEDEEYIESCATHWMPLPKPPEVEDGNA